MIGISVRIFSRLLAPAFLLLMASPSLQAGDEPLIPEALNQRLPKIVVGMSMAEIERTLSPAFPKAKARLGVWSGQTGYIDLQLDDRYSVSFAAQNGRNGEPVVHKDILIYVFDHTRKSRLELREYDWGKAPAAPATEKEKRN
jgi:hypothetical protein